MKKLLLHVCCACCMTAVYEKLTENFEVSAFWYNPNIFDKHEYEKRLQSFKKLVVSQKCPFIVDTEYASEQKKWQEYIEGLENQPEGGKRCDKCFEFRLFETARVAKGNKFDLFSTTLTISPRKKVGKINQIGTKISKQLGINYFRGDFTKLYNRSIDLSKINNLYRQNYCGCRYSIRK